jgi:hypothetical protein
MSNIKKYLWEEENNPSSKDMEEYQLYCYYLDMKEKYGNNTLEYFQPLMEEG